MVLVKFRNQVRLEITEQECARVWYHLPFISSSPKGEILPAEGYMGRLHTKGCQFLLVQYTKG